MNSSTSGWLVLTRNFVAGSHPQNHIKVKGQANPYDPQYTEYFEKRRCFAWRILCGGKPTKSASAT